MDFAFRYLGEKSKIGVLYKDEIKAWREYEELIKKYLGHSFSLLIDLSPPTLSLILKSDRDGSKIEYKGLGFDFEQMGRFQAIYESIPKFQFVHTYKKGEDLFIAKGRVDKPPYFFTISSCQILYPDCL